MVQELAQSGALYLVATPIGNLADMSARAIRILGEVDLVAAEDTRRTRQLLTHFGLAKPLVSYYRENEERRQGEILDQIKEGKKVALVSDAGMPGISDPGNKLVSAAIQAGIPVIPIPGPTALIAALAASGQGTERFVFEGFLPRSGKPRRERLAALATEERTIVLYEAPHRLPETLKDLLRLLGGERQVTVARELTKIHEEFWRGTLQEAVAEFTARELKGEFTLVVAGGSFAKVELSPEELLDRVEELIQDGKSPSEAIRAVAERAGISRRELYTAYQNSRREPRGEQKWKTK